jgi:hypothetical protein
MQQTATWNFAPADRNRLADLMKSFGCADVVAPVNAAEFGRRACELICRKKAESVTPAAAAGKYRLRALQCFETAAQSPDPYAKDVLTKLAREFMQAARNTEHGESFETGKPPLAHLYSSAAAPQW